MVKMFFYFSGMRVKWVIPEKYNDVFDQYSL